MVTYRIERLNKEFMRSIAELINNRIKNETAKDAVLTHVDTSRDLGHAKVFYTVIDESKKEAVAAALEAIRGTIRSNLGKQMHIRQIPELHFIYDDSEQKARSIDELIDRVINEDLKKGN